MPATEPKNLAYPGRNGDTEETAITNDAANKGFPAKTQSGELVFIVSQRYEHQVKVLTDGNGNQYVDDGVLGFLVPYTSEELAEDGPDVDSNAGDEIAAQAVEDAEAVEDGVEPVLDGNVSETAAQGETTVKLDDPGDLVDAA